ncbi:MAG: hypothetical protein E7591_08880 [Ruminococcaceae bacterium]|nr:hypothetical protein [Oscillospiraceae bacterium]
MNRNNTAALFLPENIEKRSLVSYEEQYEYTKALLCSDEPKTRTDVVWPSTDEVPHPNLPFKESSYFDIYYTYGKILNLAGAWESKTYTI